MKILGLFTIVFCFSLSITAKNVVCKGGKPEIVFNGTIVEVAPSNGLGGMVASFALVKYRVDKVLKGEYDQDLIIVDYPVFNKRDLKLTDNLRIDDKFYVRANKCTSFRAIRFVSGFREEDDSIKIIYYGHSDDLATKLLQLKPNTMKKIE